MDTATLIRPTCEATIDKAAGPFGFEPVFCQQQVGLVIIHGHKGEEHRVCRRAGHVESVLRQYGTPESADPCRVHDGWCTAHGTTATADHHFSRPENQGHSAFGIARND